MKMCLKIVMALMLLSSAPLVQAACVLSVSGGLPERFIMSHYFRDFELKSGWTAQWDPNQLGDAALVFENDHSTSSFIGIRLVSQAKLVSGGIVTPIQATGTARMHRGETCGQPVLGRAYGKVIPRFQTKLLAALPECSK
jgi:hypothetical protein